MDSAFIWLSETWRFITKLLPHLFIIKTTHAGVKWRYGSKVIPTLHNNGLFGTGLHFYWPLVTEATSIPIRRQTTNLSNQRLTTADDRTLAVSGFVAYRVTDATKTITNCWDYEDVIKDFALAAVAEYIRRHSVDVIIQSVNNDQEELQANLNHALKDSIGVEVLQFTLTDVARCRVISLFTDGGSLP